MRLREELVVNAGQCLRDARQEGQLQRELLVLPLSPQAAIPQEYRNGWSYFVTVETTDRIFGDVDAKAIEAEIAASGFAVVTPHVPDRR